VLAIGRQVNTVWQIKHFPYIPRANFLKQKNYNLKAEKRATKHTGFGDINYAKTCADTINKHFWLEKEETNNENVRRTSLVTYK